MVTKYYNRFIELAQYCMAGNILLPTLISKFISRLWLLIANKIIEHQFNTLMDCYASAQLAEANIESKNVEGAQARNPESSRNMTQRGSSGWHALSKKGSSSSSSSRLSGQG